MGHTQYRNRRSYGMSANNVVRIRELTSGTFLVSDDCVETNEVGYPIVTIEGLENAVHAANKYMEEEIVEYGISINLIK